MASSSSADSSTDNRDRSTDDDAPESHEANAPFSESEPLTEQQQQAGGDTTSHEQQNNNTILIVDNEIIDSSETSGLCGAIPEVPGSGACGLRMKDLRERGGGLISKFEEKGEGLMNKMNMITTKRSSTGLSSVLSGGEASLYDPSLYLCGDDGNVMDCGGEDGDDRARQLKLDEEQPIPASVIGDPSRTICVVTTAALPWRTGTAVNPLLRALYLVRYQNERRREQQEQQQQLYKTASLGALGKSENTISTQANSGNTTTAKTGSVVLVIPWLESPSDRQKLYNSNNFSNSLQQEEWIRTYSSERCGMPIEAAQLKMIFYPAFYVAGFGSIFPKVDLCNFIPRDMVDVAILEEPEHLNWFRMPTNNNDESVGKDDQGGDDDDEGEENTKKGGTTVESSESSNKGATTTDSRKDESTNKEAGVGRESGVYGQKVEVTISESSDLLEKPTISMDMDDAEEDEVNDGNVVTTANERPHQNDGNSSNNKSSHSQAVKTDTKSSDNTENNKLKKKYIDKTKLGWTHRFHFVVGIVHTNYEAYARQYGIGASLIAAPAIGAVSALTIRAHCHEVIKLSDTLPSFAPGKERTCNVHGVRREFLEGIDLSLLAEKSVPSSSGAGEGGGKESDKDDTSEAPSPVYFIGKLVWAKGFDLMLELQDIFRKRNNGNYFPIDIYGGGPDEKAIARAFHGRNHKLHSKRPKAAPVSNETPDSSSHPAGVVDSKDLSAAAVFTNPQSIKDQSSQVLEQMKQQQRIGTECGDDVVSQYLSLGFEVCQMNGSATYVKESRRRSLGDADAAAAAATGGDGKYENRQPSSSLTASASSKNANPLDILGDLSEKSFDTGVKTSQAVYNIADSSIKNILNMSFSQLKHPLKARKIRKEKKKEKQVVEGDKSKSASGTEETTPVSAEENKNGEDNKPKFVFDPPASRYEWRRNPIPAKFPGVIDHAQLKNVPHKIFLNPSTSEVLCTTTAEALAMNKFVILPKHPSNEFFLQFTNCLAYNTLEECAEKMAWALERAPTPLSEEERRKFTWEAATERLLESSIVTVKQARERAENGMDKTDARIAYWLSESGEKSNMIRNLFHKKGGGGGGSGDLSPMVVEL